MMGYRGAITAEVGPKGLARWSSSGSWRILGPILANPGGPCEIRVVGQSGGLKGGDVQRLDLALARGSCCRVSPVAAEHILPGNGQWAHQRVRIDAGRASRLYWAAAPVIPHAGARLHRRTSIRRADATVWLAIEEFITPGRIGSKEPWTDVAIDSRMMVWEKGTGLVVWDRLRLGDEASFGLSISAAEAYWSVSLLAPETIWHNWPPIRETGPATWTRLPGQVGRVVRALGSYRDVVETQQWWRNWIADRFFISPGEDEVWRV